MKKFIVFAVVLALLVPAAAFAATEFSLGGFIKLDSMWDSDNGVGKNINVLPSRNNNANFKHGRLKFTAQGSRFSFTIKGPDLWGAKTTGFIEMDFDSTDAPIVNNSYTASNSYTPRLRHAMFRFNWPTSELLFGHYWSMFCEYYAESAEDGPLQMTGTPTARFAQVRFTQKFLQDWTVAALVGDPSQARLPLATTSPYGTGLASSGATAAMNNGQAAESPHIQGKISYAHDFWGKAAYYGKPTPFTVQFVGGWQRNVLRQGQFATSVTFNEINGAASVINNNNQYLNPWLAMGSVFIPVLATQSANLAGTASILTQWWIGQGVEVFGFSGVAGNLYNFNNNRFGLSNRDGELLRKFGGFVEGQYYFNNQWFVNALYAVSKTMGVNRSAFVMPSGLGGNQGSEVAFSAGEASTIQQVNLTLWYRPIQAIKFGLQYSYVAANFLQVAGSTANPLGVTNNTHDTNFGDNHRVEFVGFFYF
jgi:hypothetical protein